MRSRLRTLKRILTALIVLTASAIIVVYFASDQEAAADHNRAQLVIDPNAGDKVEKDAVATPAPTAEPGVIISGWSKMVLPAGVTEAAVSLPNSIKNEGLYYLSYELRLKDTEEVLFTTGLIPPGLYCNAVTLGRALEAGEYSAIIRVQPYRISDQTPTGNNADLETLLIVE